MFRSIFRLKPHVQDAYHYTDSYTGLDPANHEIRILSLEPGAIDEPLACSVTISSLDSSRCQYEALSWTWGDSKEQKKSITVNGDLHSIPPNLFDALLALRRADQPRQLWIDCICINQKDNDEKATQIPLMANIYGRAQHVIIWLGKPRGASDRLLKAVLENKYDESSDIPLHAALLELDGRDYFTRVWTMQEFVIPLKEPLLVCGLESAVCWDCFLAARESNLQAVKKGLDLFAEMTRTLRTGSREEIAQFVSQDEDDLLMRELLSLDIKNIITRFTREARFGSNNFAVLRSFYTDACHGSSRGGIDLSQAMIQSRGSQATDARDHVYGILGLVSPVTRHAFVDQYGISYSTQKKPSEVYADAMHWMLRAEGARALQVYDMYPLSISSDATRPSWIPDFDHGQRLDRTFYQFDELRTLNPLPSVDDGKLSTKGIAITRVDRVIAFRSEAQWSDWTQVSRLFCYLLVYLVALAVGLAFGSDGLASSANMRDGLSLFVQRYYYVDHLMVTFRQILRLLHVAKSTRPPEALWETLLGNSIYTTSLEELRQLEDMFAAYGRMRIGLTRLKAKVEILGNASYYHFMLAVQDSHFFVNNTGTYGITRGKIKRGDTLMLLFPDQYIPFIVRDNGTDIKLVGVAQIPAAVREEGIQRESTDLKDVTIA